MKKIVFILLALVLTKNVTQAQEGMDPQQREQVREKINAAKAAYITQRLELTTQEAEKFWPIYSEFSQKRMALKRRLLESRKTLRDSSDVESKELIALNLELRQQEVNLEKEYADRFLKVLPASKLVKLKEAEEDFRRLVLKHIRERGNDPRRLRESNSPKLKEN